jgi:hypothetical protein
MLLNTMSSHLCRLETFNYMVRGGHLSTLFCVISGFRSDVHEIWDLTQRPVVIPYRRFGQNYRTHQQGSVSSGNSMPTSRNLSVEMGLTGCPERPYETATQSRVKSQTRVDFNNFALFVSPSNLCLIP